MQVSFADVLLELPAGWTDITDDLPEGAPPTLAPPDGEGCIQFSTAIYSGGVKPDVTVAELRKMLDEFCMRNDLAGEPLEAPSVKLLSAGMLSRSDTEMLAAWYLTDGANVSFVTFVGGDPKDVATDQEFQAAQRLISSIAFPPQ